MTQAIDDVSHASGFLPDYGRVSGMAHEAGYRRIESHSSGIFMERVALFDGRPFTPIFEETFGVRLSSLISYFRKYRRDSQEKTFIHSDRGVADWSAVLSIQIAGRWNGAFRTWRHKDTGLERPEKNDLLRLQEDGLDSSLWEPTKNFQLYPNTCIFYRADLFHSRWPKEWLEDWDRIVAIFFFNERRG